MSETIPTPKTDAQCGCNWSREMERELAAARAEVEALRDFALYYARCPCCQEAEKCTDDCTFASDAPNDAEAMKAARAALAKEKAS